MRSNLIVATGVMFLTCGWSTTPTVASVLVGDSSLIGTLDYSDTFTLTGTVTTSSSQRVDGKAPGGDQPAGTNLNLETVYGSNPATAWHTSRFRFNKGADAVVGTADDRAATGDPATFAYGLRDHYVIQVDAMLSGDRLNFTDSPEGSSLISGAGALSVFIRKAGGPNASVGLYNVTYGEKNTGLSTGITDATTYHNFAIDFDHTANTLEVYVDQVSVGAVDLSTFMSGHFALPSGNAAYIGAGGSLDAMDNFQVGAPIPEPMSMIILASGLLGLLVYAWRRR